MMKNVKWDIGWGAVLAVSFAYFFDETGIFAASIPAVLAHEIGHVLALRLCGVRLRKVTVRIFGAKIDYCGIINDRFTALSFAAGPLFGAAYCVLAYCLLGSFGKLSAMVSMVLTVFNSLPVLPLDGGEVMACFVSHERAVTISCIASLCCMAVGAVLLIEYSFAALLIMGAGLFVYNLFPKEEF